MLLGVIESIEQAEDFDISSSARPASWFFFVLRIIRENIATSGFAATILRNRKAMCVVIYCDLY